MPPEAEEVAVDTAFAAAVPVAHASAAAVTDQRAFQVMGMPPRAVSSDTSPSQNFLHLVPGLVVNERLVSTVVDQFSVTNLAHVIRVTQHAVDLAVVQRRAHVLDCGAAFKSTFLELITQGRDTPVATRIGLERPADMLGFLVVEGHTFYFAAFDACQGVDIPDGGDPVGAAVLGFLGNALLGFIREVAGVELGHTGQDVVHQHARGCLVDRLRR